MKQNSSSQQSASSAAPVQKEVTIPQALEIAAKHHNAGNLSTAEKLYRKILTAKPDHANATHLLGVIAHQKGKHDLAVDLITKAISLQPNLAKAHNNLGLAQHTLLRLKDAVASYRKALAINPQFAQAHGNLGVALKDLGKIKDAVTCYREAIALKPDYAEAYYNLGNALRDLDNPADAVTSYNKALNLNPRYAEAHNNLGSVLRDIGKPREALSNYRKALDLNPEYAEAHNNLGNVLRDLGEPEEAVISFQQALDLKPEYAEALNNLGATLHELEKLQDATARYRKALDIKPEYAEAHNNLGSALRDLEKPEDAVASYLTALELKPDFAEARCNLGNVLRHLGKTGEAIANFNEALNLKPDFPEAHNGLGTALKEVGKLEEAIASYQRALDLEPEFAEAHNNLGMLQLLTGDFQRGWKNYHWRRKVREYRFHPREYRKPLWDGSKLKGETIFIHPEQGLGDFFQFVRYVPLVVALGGKVTLEAPTQIARLLKDMEIADTIVTSDKSLPTFDYHVALMDLPKLFGTTLENIPSKTPYLMAPQYIKEQWKKRLGTRANFRLGIVWSGNQQNRKLLHKSVDLKLFEPLLKIPDITVYSLQRDKEDEVVKQFGKQVFDLSPQLTDFSETAGAISQLDLVISVDTSVAHLAGALGHAVWTLLPFTADWRWLLERDDSPWYPTMRLFRQSHRNDWGTVLHRVETELIKTIEVAGQCK